eukprot:CAMPEP_0206545856 /NCGR_PEP_ID=MMETSP0325_2-20121206/12376_1 /ASSEMBLY_ACC=CAM_ASM_000347 /TAXON_ID=2866 /ORGANISM="Crypthecodinium cohnii, Strain Seligo" /LENGTH=159 /DNA_ID=CAMNT_0054044903 /DNA_START=51 /DNA_END=531 /DNA_ORIENTATION=+
MPNPQMALRLSTLSGFTSPVLDKKTQESQMKCEAGNLHKDNLASMEANQSWPSIVVWDAEYESAEPMQNSFASSGAHDDDDDDDDDCAGALVGHVDSDASTTSSIGSVESIESFTCWPVEFESEDAYIGEVVIAEDSVVGEVGVEKTSSLRSLTVSISI